MMRVLFCHRVTPALRKHYRDSLPEEIELIFPKELTEDEYLKYAPDIDIVVGYKFTKEFLDSAKKLKHIQMPWTGAETLDFDLLGQYSHFTISNSHSNSLAIAEHAVALFLSAAKNIVYRDSIMRKGDWSPRYGDVTNQWLTGKTLGIIGYGAIGGKVARILRNGFQMKVLGIKRKISDSEKSDVDFLGSIDSLNYILETSDYLLIALPFTSETKNLIGQKELSLLKPNCVLVNVGRGKVINEEALYNFLKSKESGAAGIDVWYNYPSDRENPIVNQNFPFEEIPFLVMSPHSSFKVENREVPFSEDIITNILLISKGSKPTNMLNLDLGY
jgi:phosphoglycerate dehydrogenase-like enzyme